MRYYAVIDTNVLVSALLKWTSVPGRVGGHVLTGNIIPLLNDEILREYNEVLHRPKFKFPRKAVDVFLQGIVRRGVYVEAGDSDYILPDPKDAVFYEVVMEHRKEHDSYWQACPDPAHPSGERAIGTAAEGCWRHGLWHTGITRRIFL